MIKSSLQVHVYHYYMLITHNYGGVLMTFLYSLLTGTWNIVFLSSENIQLLLFCFIVCARTSAFPFVLSFFSYLDRIGVRCRKFRLKRTNCSHTLHYVNNSHSYQRVFHVTVIFHVIDSFCLALSDLCSVGVS